MQIGRAYAILQHSDQGQAYQHFNGRIIAVSYSKEHDVPISIELERYVCYDQMNLARDITDNVRTWQRPMLREWTGIVSQRENLPPPTTIDNYENAFPPYYIAPLRTIAPNASDVNYFEDNNIPRERLFQFMPIYDPEHTRRNEMSLHATLEHVLHHHRATTRAIAYMIAGIQLPTNLFAEAMHPERNFTQWDIEFPEQFKVSPEAIEAALQYRVPSRPCKQPPYRRELDLSSPTRILTEYQWMFEY